jgi:IS30 family transposase
MSYLHLTSGQRTELAVLLRAKTPKTKICQVIGKHRSTLWREIQRNKDVDERYRATSAKQKTTQRRVAANQRFRKIRDNRRLRRHIVRKLKCYWSPEQIAGRLRSTTSKTIVSHQTIYTFVYAKRPDLVRYLRCQKGSFRRRYGTRIRERERERLKKRWIDTRPAIVDLRARLGDWEGDLVIGTRAGNAAILTNVERRSGYLLADKLTHATGQAVRQSIVRRMRSLPRQLRYTLTLDNDRSMSDHEGIERDLKQTLRIYFANPYHSWERGTNENTNGLLRQFFPKHHSLATVTQADVDRAMRLLNSRPRKRLGYRSPQEVFSGRCALD